MNSFSPEWGLGLEENVLLLPTFLIRRSRWSSSGSEAARPHSHRDRWLISALLQEDMHWTPTQTYTCKHKLSAFSLPPQNVCTESKSEHKPTEMEMMVAFLHEISLWKC